MAAKEASATSRHYWIAYAAAGWALIFAVFHIVWAAGWYVGLDPVQAKAAFAVPWKLAYDLVAAAMCIVAVPVSLALAMPWGRRVPRRLLVSLTWTGTGLLLLRAVASLVQAGYFLVTGQFSFRSMGGWEPWFYVGAALFTSNLWLYWRRERPPPPPSLLAHSVVASLLMLGCARSASRPSDKPTSSNRATANASIGSVTDSVQWMQVATDSGIILAAVAQPKGPAPFRALVILHGTHGFAEEYVALAQEMAQNGVLGVAACWFQGRRGAGTRFITPIECSGAPALVEASGPERFRVARLTIGALIQKVRTLPNVRADRVALFGHSRGAGAALDYVLTHPGDVQAVVLNSGGYPSEVLARASEINVPILILHGTADSPADGGSAFTHVEMARRFEEALRVAHKHVETKYYHGGRHNSLFDVASQHRDAVQRVAAFLRRSLSN